MSKIGSILKEKNIIVNGKNQNARPFLCSEIPHWISHQNRIIRFPRISFSQIFHCQEGQALFIPDVTVQCSSLLIVLPDQRVHIAVPFGICSIFFVIRNENRPANFIICIDEQLEHALNVLRSCSDISLFLLIHFLRHLNK